MLDSFCAATKTIPDRAFVHSQKLVRRGDLSDGAKLRRADLESIELHIG